MMKNDFETLYAEMLSQLETINGSMKDHVRNLSESLTCTVSSLNRLHEMARSMPFTNDGGESEYFKYVKPRCHCWHIYVIEWHHILNDVPVGTDQQIRDYYMDELGVINRYFRRYEFYYQYYLADESVMDTDFFLSRTRMDFPPVQEDLRSGAGFSTNLGFLFAKFRALEMLRDAI